MKKYRSIISSGIAVAVALCALLALAQVPAAASSEPTNFITSAYPSHWGRSDLRAYLNGTTKIDNSLPLSTVHSTAMSSVYYESQFSDAEYAEILPFTYSTNSDGSSYVTTDKFWLPSANYSSDQILYWGADDISADSALSVIDTKRIIPMSYWPTGNSWTRSARNSSVFFSKRGDYSTTTSVTNDSNVAAAMKVNIDSVDFAAVSSAAELAANGGAMVYNILGSNKFGSKTAEPLPDYGMYLKKRSNESFTANTIDLDEYSLNIRFTGGVEVQFVVVQAYTSDSLTIGTEVYSAAKRISISKNTGFIQIPVSSWGLDSLDGYTIKVWMEDVSNGASLAPATEPATFVGSNGIISKTESGEASNLRVFSTTEDLWTSWGTLQNSTDLVGQDPTNQKIFFGTDSTGAPLSFWIAGKESYTGSLDPGNGDGQLDKQGSFLVLYQAKAVETFKFNSSTTTYSGTGKAVTLSLENNVTAGGKYPESKITLSVTGSQVDKSLLRWQYRGENDFEWTDGKPSSVGTYHIRCYLPGVKNDYETTYSAPVAMDLEVCKPKYYSGNTDFQDAVYGSTLSSVDPSLYNLGYPTYGDSSDIITGKWVWVDEPSTPVGEPGGKFFMVKFIPDSEFTGPLFDWSHVQITGEDAANAGVTLSVKVVVFVVPMPIKINSASLTATEHVYNGEAPELIITDGNGQQINIDTYFDVVWPSDPASVGSKQVTVSFKSNYGNDPSSAVQFPLTLNYTVKPKQINVSALEVEDKTYDGTEAATVSRVIFDGLVGSEDLVAGVDYTVSNAVFDDENVGENKTVSATVTLISDRAKKYRFPSDTLSVSVEIITSACINKATPNASQANTDPRLEATHGQTLADISGGLAAAIGSFLDVNGHALEGSWSWKQDGTTPVGEAGENTFVAVFTPIDSSYTNVNVNVKVTVPAPETTGPEDTTTVPEDTTTVPEDTTTVPEDTTTLPEDTTTVPEDTTTTPEDTTSVPEGTTSIPEGTTSIPEGTTTVEPDGTTKAPDTSVTTYPAPSDGEPDKHDGLDTGAIIGIAVGSTLTIGAAGFAGYWFVIRKRK